MREVRSFLGHAGFYRHFIREFSKVGLPLSNLLQKEVEFEFDDKFKEAFDCLKRSVTTTPIIQAPDWTDPFELMCDASNYTLGVVLAQRSPYFSLLLFRHGLGSFSFPISLFTFITFV